MSPSDDTGDSGDDDNGPFPGSRREARERAFHLLYESEMKGEGPDDVLASLPLEPDEFAVELAQRFSTDESSRFVNGMLARIAEAARPVGGEPPSN